MKKFEGMESISMIEFLLNYVDMGDLLKGNEKAVKLLSNATHKDIKELNLPFVKSVPYGIVEPEDILEGNIILVYDGKSKGHNKRLAPYIRPEILREEARVKEEMERGDKMMELLFRKDEGLDNFKLLLDERQKVPKTLEFGFQESAIIILYPDGGIDVLPFDGKTVWHSAYYINLIRSSKRFASAVRPFITDPDWENKYDTYKLDRNLATLNISVLHNFSLRDMANDRTFLKNNKAFFFMFLAENLTDEQKKVLDLIEANFEQKNYTKKIYNSEKRDFESIEKRGREL